MKKNQDKMLDIIKALNQTGLLNHLILIGSWTMFFYKEIFPNFTPTIRTTDLDFYVPHAKTSIENGSTIKALKEIRYEMRNDILTNRTTFISADGFELEFLTNLNRKQLDCVKIGNTDIYAESLPYLDIFIPNYVEVAYQGIKIKIASPASFVLQKFLINSERDKSKKQKDLEAALLVFSYIKDDPKYLKELKDVFLKLSKKQRNRVLKVASANSIDLNKI